MKKIITVDGNEACSKVAYLFSDVAGIYPITPSSPMAEHIDEWSSSGKKNLFGDVVDVVEMQSEAGASGFIHGALLAGNLATTFTASQGLLLMIPNMYKIAGEMLPCVMHVAARSLSTHSLSIFGDHQDIYAARATGFCMLASSSVSDASYMAAVAHLSAIEASLPFMHFFDGFRTSHEIHKISVLEDSDYKSLLNEEALLKFRKRALNPKKPVIRGTASNDDIYFQATEARNIFYDKVPDIVATYMDKINELADTDYKPFNYYGSVCAKYVIVAMGSVCETIKETIDALNNDDYGLIEVHLYRPFSQKYLFDVMPDTVKYVAVLDRTKEAGSEGEPLYLDICSALKDKDISVVGGRYGLSSKNTTPREIKAVYDMLKNDIKNNFTIGINDNVTNLSLKIDNTFKTNLHNEFLIYGYGSDGMVSAGKSLIKLLGNMTDMDVQGYNEYDSKKSGGVTVAHIRFSHNKIRSTYYVENPSLVVITKDTYLSLFDLLSNIKPHGKVLINTSRSDITSVMNNINKKNIKEKELEVYTIDAQVIANKYGLQNKISMIMESTIIYLSKILDYDSALLELTKYIEAKFSKKGASVVSNNIASIKVAPNYLNKMDTSSISYEDEKSSMETLYEKIKKREGNTLSTNDFLTHPDGLFEAGTSSMDKRFITDIAPNWINDNCISCNQCSFVCPHSVIRPFLLDQKEYDEAPDYIKERTIKPIIKGLEEYYFTIAISIADCTGCGLCIKKCPGKKLNKALIFDKINDLKNNHEQERFDYLEKNIKDKDIDTNTTITSQFKRPRFAFSGACAGCGETSYIRLLTQLFGDELIIANATGCSSIYGASVPSMPYNVPWASSLFEDNAEFGYGIYMANKKIKKRIEKIMLENMNDNNKEIFNMWINNQNDYKITKKVYDEIESFNVPRELITFKDNLLKRSIWMIGGDGWAYDIGFSGIDHVLASGENVNILVLDTQVYSNTGGQASKSTPKGMIASFATNGKKTAKKDLARIALSYPNCYVAQINLSANMNQVLKAMKEAEAYNGPSIIIAYSPCISHGIIGGMQNSMEIGSLATKCGYFPIFRYNPENNIFTLDSKNPDFDSYQTFLESQNRYKMLATVNKDHALHLLEENKENAIKRFNYYLSLTQK